jgi:maleylacetoacetate isomerase
MFTNLLIRLLFKLPIIEYLDETRPSEPFIVPKDPMKRAKARAIAEIINSGMQPYQNANVQLRILQNEGPEKRNEWVQFYLGKGYEALEAALVESSGKYCVGDEVTIADLCLVPQVFSAYRFKVDISKFPNINRVYAELEKLPAFQKAHANNQIDSPPPQQ